MPRALRRLWLFLAIAAVAVTYLAIAPGGPLSPEYRPPSSNALSRITSGAPAHTHMSDPNAERLAFDLTEAARSGGDPIIGEAIDQFLGLVTASSSGRT
ncbi:hypothetical protein [Breoghania sp.]|uniref:hypothetical protein n=1 Tax=Breoghania sp. TaxID=2065378 RepID=UPI0029CA67EA|nr:hypothetical protein [Breoghania sp.]